MGDKFALCVGNNYPNSGADLNGCVNDANDWAALLKAQGYEVQPAYEVSANDLIEHLRWYAANLGYGDRFVFTYSGHGTWTQDQDGDESDMRDECLVGADFKLVRDDDLNMTLGGLGIGRGVLILSDSCFSGTVARFSGTTLNGVGAPRFLAPSYFSDISDAKAAEIEERTVPSTPRPTTSLISGCSDFEYSYDAWFGDRANGAFTRKAIDAFVPGISLNNWYKKIRQVLPSSSYPQTPQLTAQSLYRKYSKAL